MFSCANHSLHAVPTLIRTSFEQRLTLDYLLRMPPLWSSSLLTHAFKVLWALTSLLYCIILTISAIGGPLLAIRLCDFAIDLKLPQIEAASSIVNPGSSVLRCAWRAAVSIQELLVLTVIYFSCSMSCPLQRASSLCYASDSCFSAYLLISDSIP